MLNPNERVGDSEQECESQRRKHPKAAADRIGDIAIASVFSRRRLTVHLSLLTA